MDTVTQPDSLSILLSGQPVSLAGWFAEPLTAQQAADGLARIRQLTRSTVSGEQSRSAAQVAEMIVRYWLGHDIAAAYQNTLAPLRRRHERALLKLCYGQLLLARKVDSAWQYLDSGFELAANILQAEEYFLVLKRHQLLRALALSAKPSSPMRLNELLDEAEVIRRLTGGRGGTHRLPVGPTHHDTTD
jgi:hypothetical protein